MMLTKSIMIHVMHTIHDRVMQSEEFINLKENFIGTATTMMFSRKDALLVGGFDSFLKHSEEFDFILRFACNSKVAVLSKPLALKRHHGDNLSNDKELYFYSHYFSCKRNVLYKDKYSRVCFSSKIRGLMQRDLENLPLVIVTKYLRKNLVALSFMSNFILI